MSKIKNILIFIAIALVLVLGYVFFTNTSSSDQPSLVSSSGGNVTQSTNNSDTSVNAGDNTSASQNFLTLLLNVKTIKLDTDIFSNPAFAGLQDSSITLVPDTIIGRPNPFAQFGIQNAPLSLSSTTPGSSSNPTVPISASTPTTTTPSTPTTATAPASSATSTNSNTQTPSTTSSSLNL